MIGGQKVIRVVMTEVTDLIIAIENGSDRAASDLLPLVYDELRKLAKAKMANESPGQTIQATALVHEAYLRLLGDGQSKNWNGRGHFFGAAAEAMRRILIENARRKCSVKRGGDRSRIELQSEIANDCDRNDRIIELNDAIDKLVSLDKQKAELVKLKLFAGLSTTDAGKALGISTATAHRHWEYCRAWLKVELG